MPGSRLWGGVRDCLTFYFPLSFSSKIVTIYNYVVIYISLRVKNSDDCLIIDDGNGGCCGTETQVGHNGGPSEAL